MRRFGRLKGGAGCRTWLVACVALACASSAVRADSVWSDRRPCLISDNKAYRVGDIVTVIVQEDEVVTHSAASALSKSTGTTGTIDAADIPSLASGQVTPLFKGNSPKVQFSSSRTLDGKGSYNLQGSMQTQLTAVVMDVLPNGNLVIEGSRLKTSVDEKVTIRVSGIIRPEDIRNDNTVLSTALAQGKIVFGSNGPITTSSRYGWFSKFVDSIWPF